MFKLFVLASILVVLVGADYDFSDPDFNELVLGDLVSNVEDRSGLRFKRGSKSDSRRDIENHCCGSSGRKRSSGLESYKDVKKDCIKATSDKKGGRRQSRTAQAICAAECIAKNYNLLDNSGELKRDALVEHTKKLAGSNDWKKRVAEEYVDKCLEEMKSNNKDDKQGSTTSTTEASTSSSSTTTTTTQNPSTQGGQSSTTTSNPNSRQGSSSSTTPSTTTTQQNSDQSTSSTTPSSTTPSSSSSTAQLSTSTSTSSSSSTTTTTTTTRRPRSRRAPKDDSSSEEDSDEDDSNERGPSRYSSKDDDTDKGDCNPKPMDFHHCIWKKIVEECPQNLQTDSKTCKNLRKRISDGQSVNDDSNFQGRSRHRHH